MQVVVLPGNPGGAGYYVPFLRMIHAAMDGTVDACCVSYLGHSLYAAKGDPTVYNLRDQVNGHFPLAERVQHHFLAMILTTFIQRHLCSS